MRRWREKYNRDKKLLNQAMNLPSNVEKGSTEATSWMKKFLYSTVGFPSWAHKLYAARVYKAIVATCNNEQLYELNKFQEQRGFVHGMKLFLSDMEKKMYREHERKQSYIQNQLLEMRHEQRKKERLEKEKQEGYVKTDIANTDWPGGIHEIPERILRQANTIDNGIKLDDNGNPVLIWAMSEKTYNCYCALVAPFKRYESGDRSLEMLRAETIEELRDKISQRAMQEINGIKSSNVDISHVKKIMNAKVDQDIVDDLSGDIF